MLPYVTWKLELISDTWLIVDYLECVEFDIDFHFLKFGWEIPFSRDFKIVSLNWNLVPAIIHKIFETNSSLCEAAHYGKSLIFVFQEIFASINKVFILAWG